MHRRALGANGPQVSAIGLGCMSFAGFFGATDNATSLDCLNAAYDGGITFLDTADVYGTGRSETVVGDWLRQSRAQVKLATKGGIVRNQAKPMDNSPAHLQAALDGSLMRLGRDHVDLYYLHRYDADMPIEDVVGTLAGFISQGKIGGYGLSEVSPATLRRAHAAHPCTAVQSEYSLWTRQPELGMVQATAELGIAFVPFSPLGRGVFGDTYPDPKTMAQDDYRRTIPRFSPENYPRNIAMIDPFKTFARDNGWHPAACALAWLLDRGDHMIPIPGTRTAAHLRHWIDACDIRLTDAHSADIAALLPPGFAQGDRYAMDQLRAIERYC